MKGGDYEPNISKKEETDAIAKALYAMGVNPDVIKNVVTIEKANSSVGGRYTRRH